MPQEGFELNIVQTVYGEVSEKDRVRLTPGYLVFKDSIPVGFQAESALYQVKASEKTIPMRKFIETSRMPPKHYKNKDAERFAVLVADFMKNAIQTKVLEAVKDEYLLEDDPGRPGRDLNDRELEEAFRLALPQKGQKAVETESWETVTNWLVQMASKGAVVKEHQVVLDRYDLKFRHLIFGFPTDPEPQKEWAVDEAVISTLLHARLRFGARIPEDLVLFEVATMESLDELFGSHSTVLEHVLECGGIGKTGGGEAVIFSFARTRPLEVGNQTIQAQKVIRTDWSEEAALHELGHNLDEKGGTSSQQEGFAVALEQGFEISRIKRILRRKYHYNRSIGREWLENALSSQPPDLPAAEKYYVTGSFMAFVYSQLSQIDEKIGPSKYIDFYKLLTGAVDVLEAHDGLVFEDHKPQRRDTRAYRCCGNIAKSLAAVLQSMGVDKAKDRAEQIIEEFLKQINS